MRILFQIFLFSIPISLFSQSRDMSTWIDFGFDHSNKWLQIAPAKLGPNALPVPDMDYAFIDSESSVEAGAHYHYMNGDTAVNSFFSFNWNISPGRAMVKIWGQPTETFRLVNNLRDDRQIYYDDNGWMTQAGDLYISTFIQILKEEKWLPDLSINYTLKTTTGSNYHGRYTDASLDYFYFAMGKSFFFNYGFINEIRIAGMLGFYVWQTNKVEMAQDEGPVYEAGIHIKSSTNNLYAEIGGYEGYDAYEHLDRSSGLNRIEGNNDPLLLRFRFVKNTKNLDFKFEYQTGLRDYAYQTFKIGVIYRFIPKRFF